MKNMQEIPRRFVSVTHANIHAAIGPSSPFLLAIADDGTCWVAKIPPSPATESLVLEWKEVKPLPVRVIEEPTYAEEKPFNKFLDALKLVDGDAVDNQVQGGAK